MARSDPARSPYCATRHLLRNLQRPRELWRNPLARDEFAGRNAEQAMRAIANRVQDAFAEMEAQSDAASRSWQRARRVAILVRVDTERHEPRRVAQDLGLSIRQFHRERHLAHESFYHAYRQTARRNAVTVESDFAGRLLERVTALADSGETTSAVAILDDVLASGSDAAVRCEALVLLAETEAWAHRFDRARTHLRACDTILAQSELSAERRAAISDASRATALRLRWFEHGPAAASHGAGNGRLENDAIPRRTALVRASATLLNGELAQASQLLRTLDRAPARPYARHIEVDILALRAEIADFTTKEPALSEELFARAAALAAAHGLRGRELYARHQLALTRWMHSRLAEDRRAYRGLVDTIDPALPARLRSYLVFSAADIELAIGDPQRTLTAAQSALSISTNRYESFSARGLAAGALLRLGRVVEAGTQASRAADAARDEGHERVLALAQRINAQAQLASGNRRAARVAIEESIEYARRFSSPYALAQVHAIWGQITNPRRDPPRRRTVYRSS